MRKEIYDIHNLLSQFTDSKSDMFTEIATLNENYCVSDQST
jgi:hypothetical protein